MDIEVGAGVGGSGGGGGGGESDEEPSDPLPDDEDDDEGGADESGGALPSSGLSIFTERVSSPSPDSSVSAGGCGCALLIHLG